MDKRNGEKAGGEGVDLEAVGGDIRGDGERDFMGGDRGVESGFSGGGSFRTGMKNPKFDFRAEEIKDDVVGRGVKFAELKREEDLSLKERVGLAKGRIGAKWRGMLKNLRVYVVLPLFEGRRKIVSIGVMVVMVMAAGAGVWWLEQSGKGREEVKTMSLSERVEVIRKINELKGIGYEKKIAEHIEAAIAEGALEYKDDGFNVRWMMSVYLEGMGLKKEAIEVLKEINLDGKGRNFKLKVLYRIWNIVKDVGMEEMRKEYEGKIERIQESRE